MYPFSHHFFICPPTNESNLSVSFHQPKITSIHLSIHSSVTNYPYICISSPISLTSMMNPSPSLLAIICLSTYPPNSPILLGLTNFIHPSIHPSISAKCMQGDNRVGDADIIGCSPYHKELFKEK